MVVVVDINQTITQLAEGEASIAQQREAACLLLLMKEFDSWENTERAYLMLRASGMISMAKLTRLRSPQDTPDEDNGQ